MSDTTTTAQQHAEIARLMPLNNSLVSTSTRVAKEWHTLKAENTRLREALGGVYVLLRPWLDKVSGGQPTVTADERDTLQAEHARLRAAMHGLITDANRLCDRNQGGTYEDDCRRSLDKARAALTPGEK